MAPEELHAARKTEPFVPFRIHLADGKTYDIRHPEFLMVGKRSVSIGVFKNPAGAFYDYHETVALLHVVRLEPLTAKSPAS